MASPVERYTLRSSNIDRDPILWTGPKGPGRLNLVMRVSHDEGQTFPIERRSRMAMPPIRTSRS